MRLCINYTFEEVKRLVKTIKYPNFEIEKARSKAFCVASGRAVMDSVKFSCLHPHAEERDLVRLRKTAKASEVDERFQIRVVELGPLLEIILRDEGS